MSALQRAGLAREGCNSVGDDFVVIGRGRLLVGDIQMVTTGQPDPQHDACHASSLRTSATYGMRSYAGKVRKSA